LTKFRKLFTNAKHINESFSSDEIWDEAIRGSDDEWADQIIDAAKSIQNVEKIRPKIEKMFDEVLFNIYDGYIYVFCKSYDLDNIKKDANAVHKIMQKAIIKSYSTDGPDIFDEVDDYQVIQIGYEIIPE